MATHGTIYLPISILSIDSKLYYGNIFHRYIAPFFFAIYPNSIIYDQYFGECRHFWSHKIAFCGVRMRARKRLASINWM